jgi:adenylate cyclase
MPNEDHFEIGLFLEELCCNICRFRHAEGDRVPPQAISVDQEFFLGVPGAFADIRVAAPGLAAYSVEVKYVHPKERVFQSLSRKYGKESPVSRNSEVVLVVDQGQYSDWADTEAKLRRVLRDDLRLEIWNKERLNQLLQKLFGVSLDSMSEQDLLDVREAVDRAKGAYAFGADQRNDQLEAALLWHLGFWRVRELRERCGLSERSILPPGKYKDVAVLMADLCSFSSYVRDTLDEQVVQNCLTSFYAKARYQIINAGGMLYQFLGDAVIALFGIPDQPDGYVDAALDCARALVEIGNSVSNEWQRLIDRVQASTGVHIAIAMGDLQMMSLRPFSRAHMGVIGDCVNMAARLNASANSSEVVVSNTFFQRLPLQLQAEFHELDPLEARNVGRIRAWKLALPGQARGVLH